MRTERPPRREGMILLNVLVIIAIAAATVAVMIASGDIELQRSIRLHDAAQAQAYARAGELSAVTALRRDALIAPESDYYREPWAAIGQTSIAVPGGRFALAITDEQARFNINSLVAADAVTASRFMRVARYAGLNPGAVAQIAAIVAALGPLRDEGVLRTAGVAPEDLDRLRPLIAFLPPAEKLNLNTASVALITALVDDPQSARTLVERRERNGRLTEADLADAGLAGLGGFTSDHFLLTTTVRVGEVTQTTRSRLTRSLGPTKEPQVKVTGRRRTAE